MIGTIYPEKSWQKLKAFYKPQKILKFADFNNVTFQFIFMTN
jgi:hypothetical protein